MIPDICAGVNPEMLKWAKDEVVKPPIWIKSSSEVWVVVRELLVSIVLSPSEVIPESWSGLKEEIELLDNVLRLTVVSLAICAGVRPEILLFASNENEVLDRLLSALGWIPLIADEDNAVIFSWSLFNKLLSWIFYSYWVF